VSNAAKTKHKEKRKKEKQSKKLAKKALYESYKNQGANTKSKRFQKTQKGKSLTTFIKHPFRPCGNFGCIMCYGIDYKPFLTKKGIPRGMPQWLYMKWSLKT